jgi:hypothetical protein
LVQRDELVFAKGIRDMQTFWVRPDRDNTSDEMEFTTSSMRSLITSKPLEFNISGRTLGESGSELWQHRDFDMGGKLDRLIKWNVELFIGLIHNIVAQRSKVEGKRRRRSSTEMLLIPDLGMNQKSYGFEIEQILLLQSIECCRSHSNASVFRKSSHG